MLCAHTDVEGRTGGANQCAAASSQVTIIGSVLSERWIVRPTTGSPRRFVVIELTFGAVIPAVGVGSAKPGMSVKLGAVPSMRARHTRPTPVEGRTKE